MLEHEIFLRPPSLTSAGFFSLQKSILLNSGVNSPSSQRCDNLSFAPIWPTLNTEYEHEASMLGKKSPYSNFLFQIQHIKKYENVIDASPHFFITYVELQATPEIFLTNRELEDEGACSATWIGHSMAELLKNIREWQIVHGEEFNDRHPMAQISHIFFDVLNPSQLILKEIDSMPDMHLARFLKGDPNHRAHIENFPQMSENMQQWLLDLEQQYPYKSFEEMIEEL